MSDLFVQDIETGIGYDLEVSLLERRRIHRIRRSVDQVQRYFARSQSVDPSVLVLEAFVDVGQDVAQHSVAVLLANQFPEVVELGNLGLSISAEDFAQRKFEHIIVGQFGQYCAHD